MPQPSVVEQAGCPQATRLLKGTINSFVVAGLDHGKGGVRKFLCEGVSSCMMAMTDQRIH